MVAHGLGKRAEDDPELAKLFLECGCHRYAVEDRVHRHAAQAHLFLERNAELLEGGAYLRIDFIEARQLFLGFGSRVINDILVIDGGYA